jgi:biotin carboxylase
MKKKTIMIIGGGIMQVPAIKIAKDIGLRVAVIDGNRDSPGMKLADLPMAVSTRDLDGSVQAAKSLRNDGGLDAVITVGTDASITVAAVANAVGLPGIPLEVAEAATDKSKMRRTFKEKGVPCPDFREVRSVEDAFRAASEVGFPAVIKPCDNMGARGVTKVERMGEVEGAYQRSLANSLAGKVLLEEFMEGPELSIDSLVYGGEVHFTGIADRIIKRPPYFVEMGHTLPSETHKEVQDEACSVMEMGIRALGINLGAAKGDIKITSQGAKIVEIAARLSGGFMSAYTFPLATGVNLIGGAIEIALGSRPSDLTPKFNRVSAERAIIPPPGRVASIAGTEEARGLKGVAEVFILTKVGDTLQEVTSNLGKAGNVITVAATREEAIRIAEEAMRLISIETVSNCLPTLSHCEERSDEAISIDAVGFNRLPSFQP